MVAAAPLMTSIRSTSFGLISFNGLDSVLWPLPEYPVGGTFLGYESDLTRTPSIYTKGALLMATLELPLSLITPPAPEAPDVP